MLKRLIAHQILKEKSKTTSSLNLRDEVLPATSPVAALLIDQLRDSFQTRNPLAGIFMTGDAAAASKKNSEASPANAEGPTAQTVSAFRPDLLGYLASDTDKAFVDFTRAAVTILGDKMAGQPLATGGYVVFAEYAPSKEFFLLSALLNTMARPSFDKSLNLVESNPLDFEHLRHGARIRLKAVKPNREGVVQFFSQRADGVSDYFVEFLGCQQVARPTTQGLLLINELNSLPVNEKTKKQVKRRVYGAWSDAVAEKRMMTLTEIAEAAPPKEREKVLKHLTREDSELAGEFHPPPRSIMKQFVRFAFDGDGLKLEFDHNPWANRVSVDEARTVTITDVPAALVDQIKQEI